MSGGYSEIEIAGFEIHEKNIEVIVTSGSRSSKPFGEIVKWKYQPGVFDSVFVVESFISIRRGIVHLGAFAPIDPTKLMGFGGLLFSVPNAIMRARSPNGKIARFWTQSHVFQVSLNDSAPKCTIDIQYLK